MGSIVMKHFFNMPMKFNLMGLPRLKACCFCVYREARQESLLRRRPAGREEKYFFAGIAFRRKKYNQFFLCMPVFLYVIIVCFVLNLTVCYADEELTEEKKSTEPQGAVEPVDTEAVDKEEKDTEGLFIFRDPFRSEFPRKVEAKVISMQPSSQETSSSPEVSEPGEFDYSSLAVSGLMWGTDKPKAIINDEIVGIGSVVNGATIVKIDANGILFEYNDKQFLLQRTNG